MFFDYHRQYGTRIRVARIFNTYGPRMRPNDGRVVSNFIVQALRNEDITLFGRGEQTRSFCYVDDLIDGLVSFMDNEEDFVGPVNLGNPQEFTVRELAERIVDLTGSNSRLVYASLPIDDPKRRRPNIELATKRLGWKPRIELEEGLTRTIDYFRRSLAAPRTQIHISSLRPTSHKQSLATVHT